MKWCDLEAAAPELARLACERLETTRLALLGTLRRDGSPRISPVEPYLSEGHLLFGAMAWSRKVRDLARDPRCVLHGAITGPDNAEGELKLYGSAAEAHGSVAERCSEGWWQREAPGAATVFELEVEEAVFISWSLDRGEMTIRRCSHARGYRETTRRYP